MIFDDVCELSDRVYIGYTMSLVGSITSAVALAVWILVFQLSWRDWSWAPSWMVSVPEEDASGW